MGSGGPLIYNTVLSSLKDILLYITPPVVALHRAKLAEGKDTYYGDRTWLILPPLMCAGIPRR